MTILMQKLNVRNRLEVVMASQRMVPRLDSTVFAPSDLRRKSNSLDAFPFFTTDAAAWHPK